jgi:hypothetical protein
MIKGQQRKSLEDELDSTISVEQKRGLSRRGFLGVLAGSALALGVNAIGANKIEPNYSLEQAIALGSGFGLSKINKVVSKSATNFVDSTTVSHVAYNNGQWATILDAVNNDVDDRTYRFIAKDNDNNIVDQSDVLISGRGFMRAKVTDLFSSDIDYNSITNIDVLMSEDAPPGKFFVSENYLTNDGVQQGAILIDGVKKYHKVFAPHVARDENNWWTGFGLINKSDKDIDVYFRSDLGTLIKLEDEFSISSPGSKAKFLMTSLAGFENGFNTGMFEAYEAGSTLENGVIDGKGIDALVGMEVYGQNVTGEGNLVTGFNEGAVMHGQSVDGSHNFSNEFYIPLGTLNFVKDPFMASVISDGQWDGVAYSNVTNTVQAITIDHYSDDGQLYNSLDLTLEGLEKKVFTPEMYGFDRSLGGHLKISVTDGVTYGDGVFLNGDTSGPRSMLGGGNLVSGNDKSRFLSATGLYNADNSGVMSLVNTEDSETLVKVRGYNANGQLLSDHYPDFTLAANSTKNIDLEDLLLDGVTSNIVVESSSSALVGSLMSYSKVYSKTHTNVSTVSMTAVNDPVLQVSMSDAANPAFDPVVTRGAIFARAGQRKGIVVAYHQDRGVTPLDYAEFYIDGKLHEVDDVIAGAGGTAGINLDLDESYIGAHKLNIQIHAADKNNKPEVEETIDLFVSDKTGYVDLKFFDKDHNPTDTLNVNEPFYVKYKIFNSYLDNDIDRVTIDFTPDTSNSENLVLENISGQYAEGEAYIETGIAINQASTTIDKKLKPVAFFEYSSGAEGQGGVDAEYNLLAEKVYENSTNHVQLTEDNLESLAEITSRKGVLAGSIDQLDLEGARTLWNDILNSGLFAGVTINDYQNRLYINFEDSSTYGVDLGGQNYFAENNVKDLLDIYISN